MVTRALHIHVYTLPDGRVYKTIGTHAHQTHSEAIKTQRWFECGQPKGR